MKALKENLILAINPGSTSTKLALYKNDVKILKETIRHDREVILSFENRYAEKDYRIGLVLDFLKRSNYKLEEIDIFVGRGGLVRPLESGTYLINEAMIEDLKEAKYGDHASNLGVIIAYELAKKVSKKAYTVDPVVVCELSKEAKVSGFNGIEKLSIFHALNHKAVAKRYAKEINKPYKNLTLVVAHLGGGISVGLHKGGKVVDVNNAFGGEGPFTLERSGTLPVFGLLEYAFKEKKDIKQLKQLFVTKAGISSYLGNKSGIELTKQIDNDDKEALFYLEAMSYNVIKAIGSLCFVAKCKVDAIILTGGLADNKYVIRYLKSHIPKNFKVVIYPEEDELLALKDGIVRVINKEEKLKHY